MRYRGGGIGHLATRHCDGILLADKHKIVQEMPDVTSDSQDIAIDKSESEEEEDEGEEIDNDDEWEDVDEEALGDAINDEEIAMVAGFMAL